MFQSFLIILLFDDTFFFFLNFVRNNVLSHCCSHLFQLSNINLDIIRQQLPCVYDFLLLLYFQLIQSQLEMLDMDKLDMEV